MNPAKYQRRLLARRQAVPCPTLKHGGAAFRLSVVGEVKARGPLDYDVPVLRRCVDCRGLYAEPLAGDGGCPHCQRTLDLGGAA